MSVIPKKPATFGIHHVEGFCDWSTQEKWGVNIYANFWTLCTVQVQNCPKYVLFLLTFCPSFILVPCFVQHLTSVSQFCPKTTQNVVCPSLSVYYPRQVIHSDSVEQSSLSIYHPYLRLKFVFKS